MIGPQHRTETEKTEEKKEGKPSTCDACHVGQALGKAHCPLRQTFDWIKKRFQRRTEKDIEDKTK